MPKSVLRAVIGTMQFTLHAIRRTPHGASRLVQAMSAWLVKTRRAPSRHSRDARVYGHTTMAMHELSTPPPKILPYLLDYVILSYSSSPYCFFFPYSPINYAWQPLFWHILYFLLPFQLAHVSICFWWVRF